MRLWVKGALVFILLYFPLAYLVQAHSPQPPANSIVVNGTHYVPIYNLRGFKVINITLTQLVYTGGVFAGGSGAKPIATVSWNDFKELARKNNNTVILVRKDYTGHGLTGLYIPSEAFLYVLKGTMDNSLYLHNGVLYEKWGNSDLLLFSLLYATIGFLTVFGLHELEESA